MSVRFSKSFKDQEHYNTFDQGYVRGYKDGHVAVVDQIEAALRLVVQLLGHVNYDKLDEKLGRHNP